ncbi:acetylglutamate kinase [Bacteroidota bacterium]
MENLTIVKVGGKIVEDEHTLNHLLHHFASLEGLKMLIHGGGNIATEISKKLGFDVQMVQGRRITSREALDVVVMVYGGLINKRIVAGLQALNNNAIGLTGADLNIIRAVKRPVREIDYGFVGDIEEVQASHLKLLLESRFVPVIAPLTHDKSGQLFNTNADDITNSLATALSKNFSVTLVFCFDKPGVLRDQNNLKSSIPVLKEDELEDLREQDIISDGMIPKLENGFHSLKNGVKSVFLTDVDNFHLENPMGTRLIL